MALTTVAIGAQGAIPFLAGETPLPIWQFLAIETGTFTCNGVTGVTVANANVNLTSMILFSLNTVGGTVGAIPSVKTITAGTGFTVAGSASDSSVYNYVIIG